LAAADLAAKRYALAAFDLAQAEGALEEWADALDQIAAFVGEADVRRAFENSRTSQDTKQRLIDAGLSDLPKLPLNLARLLARKNRTALAGAIAAEFRQLVEDEKGVARAVARTAVPLSDAERDVLVSRLSQRTGKAVVLETEVDPALLGGVVVQIGDRLVDGSTRARLQALRDNLVGSVG
jgi:F-type H+-transporting ATPase subunit delta